MKYVVETKMLYGWENTWSDEHGQPVVFDSKIQAEEELADFLYDAQVAFESGDLSHPYLSEDYRIIEVSK